MLAALSMSKDQLAEIANRDTPASVTVPPTWPGIVAWLMGRFGVGVLVPIAFGWFAFTLYQDSQRQSAALLDAFREQTRTNTEHVHAIRELARSIEEAHRRASAGR